MNPIKIMKNLHKQNNNNSKSVNKKAMLHNLNNHIQFDFLKKLIYTLKYNIYV